jgi:hypothetical protein
MEKTLQVCNISVIKAGRLSWVIQVSPKYNHRCPYKREARARFWWLLLVILATWEAKIGRIMIQGQLCK